MVKIFGKIFITIIFFCGFNFFSFSENRNNSRKINWEIRHNKISGSSSSGSFLFFDNATYDLKNHQLPFYFEKITLNKGFNNCYVTLSDELFEGLSDEETSVVANNVVIKNEITVDVKIGYEQKQPQALVSFIPIRKNPESNKYEKLVSFNLVVHPDISAAKTTETFQKTYASASVLATGNWYRIGVTTDGIYKISYSFLKKLGMDVDNINPKNIRLYGNGGGMLPYASSIPRKDDLVENAILVQGEADSILDSLDYILFYGESPNTWSYGSDQKFHHQVNLYSDTTFYFITADLGLGKRITPQPSSTLPVTNTVTSFDDYAFHELDGQNFIKSGREWYGEYFDALTFYAFSFSFPNIDVSYPVYVQTDLAARCATTSVFNVSCQASSVSVMPPGLNLANYTGPFASTATGSFTFLPANDNIIINVSKQTSSAIGWLNYIEVNSRRQLVMNGDQMLFRDILSVGTGKVCEFDLSSSNSSIQVWEVTDPANTKLQSVSLNGNTLKYTLATDSLRKFIAFNGTNFYSPVSFGIVPNQNLHGLAQTDLIIVSHPDFMSEANTLQNLHSTNDGMSAIVVTPQQIYNEFSSGAQDVSAIRDFVKMFYDRAGNNSSLFPKYLLLIGDGSYDNKKRIANNTNFIPTYQTVNSTDVAGSYTFDEFYGCLDDNEGNLTSDLVDLGVGRLPVKSKTEAEGVVNKIVKYESAASGQTSGCSGQSTSSSFGDWRNVICFVADDQQPDGNVFVSDADKLATYVDTNYRSYNIDKIYMDSYQQESTAGGHRYPDATSAFNNRVEKGALIMNYIGHGGEVGLAHERLIEVSDINGWKNINSLPLFITATCEFSRYDDPERTSAGEYVLLNSQGGGIALLTTTRLAYEGPNFDIINNFFKYAFKPVNGKMPKLGDLYRLTKTASGASDNIRNFTLLGDPALALAYPKYDIYTNSINGSAISIIPDTMKALAKISVSGYVADKNGTKLNYNGILYPTIYDKEQTFPTLSNNIQDPPSPFSFKLQKNILYKGKASVTNGDFSFSFIVPKDIVVQYGKGRISYYAENGTEDAKGYYENVIVGGYSSNAAIDNNGPEIKLYMNDNKFVFGGTTNENPFLYAQMKDSSGINTIGNAIGHDVTAVLDENTAKSIVLNDYYQSDLNSYKSGTIKYPFSKLSEGRHTLSFKAWDVYNNSSQAYTEFIVATSAALALNHVLNYPNPFTTKTSFYFEHNQACDFLDVQIQIFTVSGKLVKTISTYVHTEGFRCDPIDWDGKDEFGDFIGKGVYIYRLKVKTSDGIVADKFEKLVVLK